MTINLDGETITVSCPGCKHEFSKTIGWLKSNSPITCPGCQHPIKIDTTDLDKGVAKVNKEIDSLRQQMKKLFK